MGVNRKGLQNFTTARAEDNPTLLRRLRAMVADLEQHGTKLNMSGRVFRYIRELEEFGARQLHSYHRDEMEGRAIAGMDGALLADTFESLKRPPEVRNWRSPRFELALKGAPVPRR